MDAQHTLMLLLVGAAAGGLGALAGIGGGVIVTPILAIYFGLPMHQAIAVSLIAVIATSTAAASVNVERRIADVDLGLTLELATTIGAATAAVLAGLISRRGIAILFVCFLLYSAASMVKSAWASRIERLQHEIPSYSPVNYAVGLAASGLAGAFSGLLGVGGGVVKVPVMYLAMRVPLRVATATSNFTIGVTAATSAYIYYGRGNVNIPYAVPVVTGVFLGSFAGARLAPQIRSIYVLSIFIAVTGWMAVQMILKIASGELR